MTSATAISLGTYVGGWRIIKTMGSRIHKMDSAQGFAAQGAGAAVILASSHVGFPLSTTHTISGAVIGSGAAKRLSAVRWGVAGNIVAAWIVTLPAAAALGGLTYVITRAFGTGAVGSDRGVRADPGRRRAPLRAPGAAELGVIRGGRGMIATIVDVHDLLQVLWTSTLAGLGTTTAYGLAILGVGRALDYGRTGRPLEAAAYGVLGVAAAAAVAGALIFGVVVWSIKYAARRLTRRWPRSRSSSSSLFQAPTEART